MSDFFTVVLRVDTYDQKEDLIKITELDNCTALSRDDEMLRLELIEAALDKGDIELAKSYISVANVHNLKGDLTH